MIIIFYLLFHVSTIIIGYHVFVTAIPVFLLLFSQFCSTLMNYSKSKPFSLERGILITIISIICFHGYMRIVAHNQINTNTSTDLQASKWIDNNLPKESQFLVDRNYVVIRDKSSKILSIKYADMRNISHTLNDLLLNTDRHHVLTCPSSRSWVTIEGG